MGVLVIAEHDNQRLAPATLNAVAAARQIHHEVDALIAGHAASAVGAVLAQAVGVRRVLLADAAHYLHPVAEDLAPLVQRVAQGYTHVLAAASSFGKDLMPRVAAMLDVMQISDVIEVVDSDTFVRPIYAGNALATIRSADPIKVLTVRSTAFDAAPTQGGAAEVVAVDSAAANAVSEFVHLECTRSERPELTTADVVVSVGRGLGGAGKLALVERLADTLGAALGASRAAVDAGFVPNDCQVGQTGKVVAPRLYIAVGISGAIQHLAGMQDSKVIVAINNDPDAPIFQVADYGLVDDLFRAVPDLIAALEAG